MKIAAQFFTLRDYCKNTEDLEATLAKVAEIGYHYIQLSGVCYYEPEWMKEKLSKYGLECVITHTNSEKMLADPEKVCDEHSIYGCDYIGLGGMPGLWSFDTISGQQVVDNFLKNYTPVMKAFKKKGKLLMYHNHQYEFMKLPDGHDMISDLVAATAPDELGFTVDVYWVQYGGKNPVSFIESLAGRVPCVHFKDYVIDRTKENFVHMAPVGYGNLDWDSIIAACEKSGTKYAVVEQDFCYDEDPFDCLKKSFDFLVSKGLEIK